MRPGILVLLAAAAAGAQTSSSTNGWSFTDILQTSTDVLVADIVSGFATDDGSQVTVKATLRVVRVLSGSATAGSDLAVTWQYQPTLIQSPAITSQVPHVRGLWFLREKKPLKASVMMLSLGGFYLPAGDNPRYYAQNAPLPYKVACEVAPVIEDLVTRHGDDLVPRAYMPVPGAPPPAWTLTVTQYNALIMALQGTGKSAAEAYAYFTALPDPTLKLIGIQGRLDTGDTTALFDLEKNLAALAPALNRSSMPLTGMGRRHSYEPARRSRSRPPRHRRDCRARHRRQHRLSVSVDPQPRVSAVPDRHARQSESRHARRRADEPLPLLKDSALWASEMSANCPNSSPLNDVAAEQKDIRFWKQWWESHRDAIAKTVTLPNVVAPARYNIPESPGGPPVAVPIEVRFLSLLMRAATPAHDPVAGQLTPSDREIYQQVVAAANAKLADIQKRVDEMINAARIAGTFPTMIGDDRLPVAKAAGDELRSRLSPAGWQVIDKFVNQAMGAGMIGSPRPIAYPTFVFRARFFGASSATASASSDAPAAVAACAGLRFSARLRFSASMMSITGATCSARRRHHLLALDLVLDHLLQILAILVVVLLRLEIRFQRRDQHLRHGEFLLLHQAGVGAELLHLPDLVLEVHGVRQDALRARAAG